MKTAPVPKAMTPLRPTLRNDCANFLRAISLAVILITIPIVTLLCSEWWPVDIVTGRVLTLGALATTNGDILNLTQHFEGDGYLTVFTHINSAGRVWHFPIDGDAPKAWTATLKRTNETVEIALLRHRFFYNIQSHAITDVSGKPHRIMEIPEDGTKPFFVGPLGDPAK